MAERELYIGYRSLPKRHRVFLWLVVPAWTILALVVGGLIASAQSDPGPAVWSDQTETMSGLVVLEPYPHLLVREDDESERTVWLVEPGKFGGGDRARPFAGQLVEITGLRLERDGNIMLEMATGANAIHPAGEGQTPAPERTPAPVGEIARTGEILDGKCFLGAMKPGSGKQHKACAVRCISGGIPAMFASPNADGSLDYFIVTDSRGGPFDRRLLDLVGEPVRVSGRVSSLGDVRLLALSPDGVARR